MELFLPALHAHERLPTFIEYLVYFMIAKRDNSDSEIL